MEDRLSPHYLSWGVIGSAEQGVTPTGRGIPTCLKPARGKTAAASRTRVRAAILWEQPTSCQPGPQCRRQVLLQRYCHRRLLRLRLLLRLLAVFRCWRSRFCTRGTSSWGSSSSSSSRGSSSSPGVSWRAWWPWWLRMLLLLLLLLDGLQHRRGRLVVCPVAQAALMP